MRMRSAAICHALMPDEQIAVDGDAAPRGSGRPAKRAAMRAKLRPDSASGKAQPATTSLISAGSKPGACATTERITCASMSYGAGGAQHAARGFADGGAGGGYDVGFSLIVSQCSPVGWPSEIYGLAFRRPFQRLGARLRTLSECRACAAHLAVVCFALAGKCRFKHPIYGLICFRRPVYQLRSGLPVDIMFSMRSSVFSFFSKSTNTLRSKSSSHCSSTTVPGSTSPPVITQAIWLPMCISYSLIKPPSFMFKS